MVKHIRKILFCLFVLLIGCNIVNAEVKWTYVKKPAYLNELKSEYNKIPQKARDLYDEEDLEIIIYGYNHYKKYAGLFNGNVNIESYKQTWLKNFYRRKGVKKNYSTKTFSVNYAKMTMIHELGHAYDYGNRLLSSSNEFKSIYNSEKSKFKKTDFYKYPMGKISANINSSLEYFASSFASYVMSPNDLKKRCPKTYDYFKRQFE